jgi:hypothetical protein
VVLFNGGIKVFDLAGNEKTVTIAFILNRIENSQI